MPFVHEIMSIPPVTIRCSATLAEAAALMLRQRLSGLPVVDAAGDLVGVITEGDFLRRPEYGTQAVNGTYWAELFGVGPAERYRRVHGLKVEDVMSTKIVSVKSNDTLLDAVRLMLYYEIKRMPVVDHGKLVGMLSRFDFLKAFIAARRELSVSSTTCEVAIKQKIARQEWAPEKEIEVSSENGRFRLSGEVQSDDQRRAAIVLAEGLAGLSNVDAQLTLVARTPRRPG